MSLDLYGFGYTTYVTDTTEKQYEREDKTMIEKPMNPYAAEDFRNAMKKASEDISKRLEDFSKDLKRVGEQIKVSAEEGRMSFIELDEMPTEYSGIMRLQYSPIGAWQDVFNILVANGYTVTATVEDATETERKLDGADKFVVIEYGEVE